MWGPKVNIPSVAHSARQGAAEVLALLAVDRLADTEVDARFYMSFPLLLATAFPDCIDRLCMATLNCCLKWGLD